MFLCKLRTIALAAPLILPNKTQETCALRLSAAVAPRVVPALRASSPLAAQQPVARQPASGAPLGVITTDNASGVQDLASLANERNAFDHTNSRYLRPRMEWEAAGSQLPEGDWAGKKVDLFLDALNSYNMNEHKRMRDHFMGLTPTELANNAWFVVLVDVPDVFGYYPQNLVVIQLPKHAAADAAFREGAKQMDAIQMPPRRSRDVYRTRMDKSRRNLVFRADRNLEDITVKRHAQFVPMIRGKPVGKVVYGAEFLQSEEVLEATLERVADKHTNVVTGTVFRCEELVLSPDLEGRAAPPQASTRAAGAENDSNLLNSSGSSSGSGSGSVKGSPAEKKVNRLFYSGTANDDDHDDGDEASPVLGGAEGQRRRLVGAFGDAADAGDLVGAFGDAFENSFERDTEADAVAGGPFFMPGDISDIDDLEGYLMSGSDDGSGHADAEAGSPLSGAEYSSAEAVLRETE